MPTHMYYSLATAAPTNSLYNYLEHPIKMLGIDGVDDVIGKFFSIFASYFSLLHFPEIQVIVLFAGGVCICGMTYVFCHTLVFGQSPPQNYFFFLIQFVHTIYLFLFFFPPIPYIIR